MSMEPRIHFGGSREFGIRNPRPRIYSGSGSHGLGSGTRGPHGFLYIVRGYRSIYKQLKWSQNSLVYKNALIHIYTTQMPLVMGSFQGKISGKRGYPPYMPFSIGNISQIIFRKIHSSQIKLPHALRGYFVEALHDITERCFKSWRTPSRY